MAKKINLSGAKEFLFNHGEKVALGTCVFLALLFGILGLMDAMGAGKSPDTGKLWAEELHGQHDRIQNALRTADIPALPEKTKDMLKPQLYEWVDLPSDYQPQPYINIPEQDPNKRHNPRALAIRTGPKGNHLEYVPALFHTYEKYANDPKVKVLGEADAGGAVGPFGPKKGAMAGPAAGNGQTTYLKRGDSRRMIVGHAVFPMKEQVLEFQRALKLSSQKEMFDAPRDDLPEVLGFDLLKFVILPNGQPASKEPEVLLMWDPAKKSLSVEPKLNKFLSVAMFDLKTPVALEPYVFAGLTMPLPLLAYGSYPRVSLDGGIESAEDMEGKEDMKAPGKKGAAMPKGNLSGPKIGPGKGPGMEKDNQKKDDVTYPVSGKTRKELKAGGPEEVALDKRLFDSDFNIYHVLGMYPTPAGDDAPKAAQGPAMPRGPGAGAAAGDRFFTAWDIKTGELGPDGKLIEGAAQPNQPGIKPPVGPKSKGSMPGGAVEPQGLAFPNWDRDAVLRFIDIDVEPGKTYRYLIRVRLKNPNANPAKAKEVAYAALTQVDELVSDWTLTESITIPHDYYLYAVDQELLDKGKAPASDLKVKDATPFQIHQWMNEPPASRDQTIVYPVGDWVIAERVLVQKGSRIGVAATVNTPFWVSNKDRFDLAKRAGASGTEIEMMPPTASNKGNGIVGTEGYPVLIDFVGGKRRIAPNLNAEEEVAVDALIVGADGKLRVLNSRDAVENTPLGRDREARVIRARERVAEVSGSTNQGPNQQKKSGTLPGVPNNN